jgi:hypothetical protein
MSGTEEEETTTWVRSFCSFFLQAVWEWIKQGVRRTKCT